MCVRHYEYTRNDEGAVMTNKREQRMQRSAAAFAVACQSASRQKSFANKENAYGSPP
jgi:hypothetical protein